MDERIKTMISARANTIAEWKANVERDQEVLCNARGRTQSAQLALDESTRLLEDAQTDLFVIVREAFPYEHDEDE